MNKDKWHITNEKSFQYDSDDDPFDFIKEDQIVKLIKQ